MLSPETRFADFPSLKEMTYLNTAAESIPPLAAREAVSTYLDDKSKGMRGRDEHFAELDRCRGETAALLGLKPEEVAFCSSTSEAYNLLASALNLRGNDEVVINDLEFPSGATPWLRWPANPAVRLWKNAAGILELDQMEPLLNENTRLVQVSLVSFLTGYRIAWAPFRDLVRKRAPNAVLSVDVTQAFGRVVLDCLDADIIVSSTYKWLLGIHGGCVVAIPGAAAKRLTTRAGGWYHLVDGFGEDRFEKAESVSGAGSFAVGMPSFASIYALTASVRYLRKIGVREVAKHADPIVARLHDGLRESGIRTMSPPQPENSSGIVAFKHPYDEAIEKTLLKENIHIMRQAGRIRIALHGYNQPEDVERLLEVLRAVART